MKQKFSGNFGDLKEQFIDDYVLAYMGLDKKKIEKEFGTTFNFVNSFLHNKVFNVDLDLYGKNARPFHNVINGVNQLIEAGLEVIVLTARNAVELDQFVDDKDKEGIAAKTNRFVERYMPKAGEVIVVDRTKHKRPFIRNAQIWIDDDYGEFLDELNEREIYIVKNLFPRNERLFAHSVIDDRHLEDQPFVREVLRYAEKTGASKVMTDLDDTLVEFKGCFKRVCDYALAKYPKMFREWAIKKCPTTLPETITSKRISYKLWQEGFFGNRLRAWDSLEEILRDNYVGTVTMRYKGSEGGGFCTYEVPISKIPEIQEEWVKKGAVEELITFNESAPDHKLLIQGEVMMEDTTSYKLFYSLEKKKMREALKDGKHAQGLKAKLILKHFLSPSSWSDMQVLLEQHPNHAIEFGAYSMCLGNTHWRNTIIWEVRQY